MSGPPSLRVNDASNGNHWVAFHAVGSKSNRDGIGARITLKASPRLFVDEVRSGSSYISNNDVRVHFGLGTATKIDSVELRWPSALLERFQNLAAAPIHTLKHASDTPPGAPPKQTSPP